MLNATQRLGGHLSWVLRGPLPTKLAGDETVQHVSSSGSKKDRKDAMVALGNNVLQQQLDADKEKGTTVPRWLQRWPVSEGAVAPYLKRQYRLQLRKGRRFKIMLRASAWRPDENESRDQCPRCHNGDNSISHLLFHYSAIDTEIRKEFLDKMRTLIPNFENLTTEEQVDLSGPRCPTRVGSPIV